MEQTAAEIFAAGMTLEELKAEYQKAINTRDGQTQRWMSEALAIKRRGDGQLREIVEPPSRENGNRHITRYEGDPMEWMKHFMAAAYPVGKLNHELAKEAGRAAELAAAAARQERGD